MPIFEQGYKPYEGELSRTRRVLPIAWEGFRTRLRWWVWLLIAGSSLFPTIIFFVLVLIANGVGQLFGGAGPQQELPAPTVAFQSSHVNPAAILGMISEGSYALPWEVLHHSMIWGVLLPAVACAGILSADRRTGALQIYFARPVTRRDYLLAKVTTVAAYQALVTLVPALGIWLLAVLTSPDWDFFLSTWATPFVTTAGWLVMAYWTCAIVLALSTYFKRPVFVGVTATVAYLGLAALGQVLSHALEDQAWQNLSPGFALGGAIAPLFGLELQEWQQSPWPLVYALGLPTLLYAYVWSRVRAVEVQT